MRFFGFGRAARPAATPTTPASASPLQSNWAKLVSLVGVSVAVALAGYLPHIESGRTVEVEVSDIGEVSIEHVSGRQYLEVYKDIVGVNTACDGITTINGEPMPDNHTFTEEECEVLLLVELNKHAEPIMACSPGIALSDDPAIERRREGPRFVANSLGYNVGVAGWCGSTANRRFTRGDYNGGCEAATWWNKAGGRVLPGLVRRRNEERLVCDEGLGALAEIIR